MFVRTLLATLAAWAMVAAAAAPNDAPDPGTAAVTRGARTFYETRRPNSDRWDLMVRDGAAARLIATGPIKSFLVSPDGTKVAVALQQNEPPALTIHDTATGTATAATEGDIAGWSGDSRTLYVTSRQADAIRLSAWSAPSQALAVQIYAGVGSLVLRRGEAFMITGEATKLMALRTGEALSTATEILSARDGEVLDAVYPASDAIYILAHDGSHVVFLRLAARASGAILPPPFASRCRNCRSMPAMRAARITEIAVPDGTIATVRSDPQMPGFWLRETTSAGPLERRYNPSTGRFVCTASGPSM